MASAPCGRWPRARAHDPRLTRLRSGWAALSLGSFLLLPGLLGADGGHLVLNEAAGSFRISAFTEPTPLRVGPIEVSVLVQEAVSGALLLDADVTVELRHASADRVLHATLARGHAQNQTLYGAGIVVPQAGRYKLTVGVRRGAARGLAAAEITIEQRGSTIAEVWPYLAIPPLAIALFALHQRLKRRLISLASPQRVSQRHRAPE